MKKSRNIGLATAFAMALSFGAWSVPADAQQQGGLVNVAVDDVVISPNVNVLAAFNIAAVICDVNVNVIAAQFRGGNQTVCRADQDADGTIDNIQIIRTN